MISRNKRRRSIKGIYILLILFVVLLGLKLTWSTDSLTGKLISNLAERKESAVTVSPPKIVNKTKYRIVVDAGHGGKDPGAPGASGGHEKIFNLALAQRVYQLLKEEPMFEPRMTRTEDQFVELQDRAAIANDWNADALISIHANTYKDPKISGTETLYRHSDSIPLAEMIQEQVSKALGFPDRGIKMEQLKVLSLSKMPAVVAEIGYITNPEEEAILLSNKGQDLAAQAIVDGLKNYFGQNGSSIPPKTEESRQIQTPPALNQNQYKIENKVYFDGSAKDGKQVAFTFDDGPDTIATPKILDILKENKIKATFFILGNRAKSHPELIRRIVDEGHAIGNHSWSHPNFDKTPMNEAMKEIEDTQDVIEDAAGVRPILFRAPYGALPKDKLNAINKMNLAVIGWTVDTLDWTGVSSNKILSLVHKQLRPGGIVLQHSANGKKHMANTIEALQQMIPELKEKGYTFVTVPQLLHLPDSQSQ
ncbi:N-acetylmuramoyl-L-alanine amidase [Paenibacillus sp. J22TS3]|uniref:N-acetylmuramoyl-L-alanine amidase n=1 Tax=Paenibacillus sp. J22TS3 TaxID=2807192 RepID=UPI001B0ECAEF|nr:N-acetylmuramoyl-L-alanine amidase [Paenibacillus sp. J22TS3]GIP23293.1 hypothetical protein J22TS3_35680 [Paenibacillus sp. J22TS3]